MEALEIPNWNVLSLAAFLFCLLAGAKTAPGQEAHAFGYIQLPLLESESQRTQAKELLTRTPQSLGTLSDLEFQDVGRAYILDVFQKSMPRHYRDQAALAAQTLILEANRYHLDPMFLLAVIMTESRFNPHAIGRHGEQGLMQVLPKTGAWIARRSKIKTRVDLFDPVMNIKIGAAYFAHLRAHFGPIGSRYLAAYNMGIVNVHRLLTAAKEPKVYANRVLKNYRLLYRGWAAARSSKVLGVIPATVKATET